MNLIFWKGWVLALKECTKMREMIVERYEISKFQFKIIRLWHGVGNSLDYIIEVGQRDHCVP